MQLTSTQVTGASLDPDSFFRFGPRGDIWCTTWTADGGQITAGGDPCLLYELRGTRTISVKPSGMKLINIGSSSKYPAVDYKWYPYGIVEVGGRLHQFVGFCHKNIAGGGALQGSMLVYSEDGGLNWKFPDGSAATEGKVPSSGPLTDAQAFFGTTPDYPFTQPAFLQYGRGYADNTDGYVYVYAQASLQPPPYNRKEELNLARAPKAQILDRSAYEFFEKRQSNRSAVWTSDINRKGIVHKFKYAGATDGSISWHPGVAYIKAINYFVMVTFSIRRQGLTEKYDLPSRLEILASKNPWGPWTLVHAEDPWGLPGDNEARLYTPKSCPRRSPLTGALSGWPFPTPGTSGLHRIIRSICRR